MKSSRKLTFGCIITSLYQLSYEAFMTHKCFTSYNGITRIFNVFNINAYKTLHKRIMTLYRRTLTLHILIMTLLSRMMSLHGRIIGLPRRIVSLPRRIMT